MNNILFTMTEEEIKAKRKEILEWEEQNRTLKNRSMYGKFCAYRNAASPDNPGCAVGRLLPVEVAKQLDGLGPVSHIFHLLPMKVASLGFEFLTEIQTLHDNASYFTEEGLSTAGVERVNHIKQQFCV